MTKNIVSLWSQPMKFILVGTANTICSYVLYAILLYIGLGFVSASFLTLIGSIVVGFLSQGYFVFGGLGIDAMGRFIIVWIFIYAVYLCMVWTAEQLGINNYWGGLLATPMVAALSYVLHRKFVFRH